MLLWIAAAAAGADPADEAAVPIAPGDVLEIRVWREPDLSGEHRVGVDGLIHHVLAGDLEAAGRTADELAEALRTRLESDYLREARVAVTLLSSPHRKASVLGAVLHPGSYPVARETRVLDLLVAAGGAAPEARGGAVLLRAPAAGRPEAAAERVALDLTVLLEGRDPAQNVAVLPGDVLLVDAGPASVGSAPPGEGPRVRVVGEVENPGSYPLTEAGTVLDAVLAAGGLAEYAAGNRARLVRSDGEQRTEERVRLDDLLRGRGSQDNVALRDGDLLIVPESLF